jgi:hypothetical protein
MKCYLDMDGLLVNLFDHVANHMHGKRYQHLSDGEKAENREVWEDKKLFNHKFGPIDKFFENLNPYKTNDALLEVVIEKFGEFYICSKPTKLNKEACIKGKLSWIESHILPKYERHLAGILFPEKKEIYALGENNVPNILIDDYTPYIEAWNKAGGIGIRIRADKYETKKKIKDHLREKFAEIETKQTKGEKDRPSRTKTKQRSNLEPADML